MFVGLGGSAAAGGIAVTTFEWHVSQVYYYSGLLAMSHMVFISLEILNNILFLLFQ